MSTSSESSPPPELQSPTQDLLGFVWRWREAALPQPVEARTRQLLVDTLACYVGGTALDAAKILLQYAARSDGQVPLFPLHVRITEQAASFASSHISGLLDAAGTLYNRALPAAAIVMPCVIAGAAHGKSLTEVLHAIAIGYEVQCRLGLSCVFHTISADGSIRGADVSGYSWTTPGIAVALSLLMGLDTRQTEAAFNLGAFTAPIPTNTSWHITYPPESMAKYFLYGASTQAAFTAVELSALGFLGPRNVLDGPRGFRRITGALEWDNEVLREGVPGSWLVCETAYKRYPACRLWSGALYGLEQLVSSHDFSAEDVEHVQVKLAMLQPNMAALAERKPRLTAISAQFSVPHGCAQVLQRCTPGPAWLMSDALTNRITQQLVERTEVKVDPHLNRQAAAEFRRVRHFGFRLPWAVSVKLKSGDELSASGTNAPGDWFVPEMRMSYEDTMAKFREYYRQANGAEPPDGLALVISDQEATSRNLLEVLASGAREP